MTIPATSAATPPRPRRQALRRNRYHPPQKQHRRPGNVRQPIRIIIGMKQQMRSAV
jgi:hypothetical protein